MKKSKGEIQKEILDTLPKNPHGLLLLSPRFGKTKLIIDLIKRDKPKSILWVTPSVNLRDVGIPEEFHKWKAKSHLKKTQIVCYGSLKQMIGHYDLIILDEFQYVTDNNMRNFFKETAVAPFSFNNIVGISGTMPTHEEKQKIYQDLNLKVLAEMSIDEAVEHGMVSDYKINVVKVPLDSTHKNVKVETKNNTFWTTEKQRYDYLTEKIDKAYLEDKPTRWLIMNRMHFIYNAPSKTLMAKRILESVPGRKLVFAGSIAQSKEISNKVFNSKTDDTHLNEFLEGKTDHLICVNSGGVGTTYKNVDHVIIVQSNSNKKGDSTQKIARSLLKEGNKKAQIWVVVLANTQDEVWVAKALKDFNQEKITTSSF